MSYLKIYNNLIETRRNLNRNKKTDGVYYENHHIIPRSLGGNNLKDNLVLLTFKEHFLAHLILVEISIGNDKFKMATALLRMCTPGKKHIGKIVSARQYEKAKQIYRDNAKGRPKSAETRKNMSEGRKGMKFSDEHRKHIGDVKRGNPQSEETKKKRSEAMKTIGKNPEYKQKLSEAGSGENNGMFGISVYDLWVQKYGIEEADRRDTIRSKKLTNSKKGQKRSEKIRAQMSISSKGKPKSEEHRKHISEINKGKKLTEEHKAKIKKNANPWNKGLKNNFRGKKPKNPII